MHAVLPHTALQSVVSLSGLARQNPGFVQGEKPVLSEEGTGPAKVITCRASKARTFLPLAQDRSQSPPNETINVSKCCSMGMLEVPEPALEDRIELTDDGLQVTATGAAGLSADFTAKCLAAFRAHPASSRLKPIT